MNRSRVNEALAMRRRVPAMASVTCAGAVLLGAMLIATAGCVHPHAPGAILKPTPRAAFPNCTYYGYEPTCWTNWNPGWNCCPLPATEIATPPGAVEMVPAPMPMEFGKRTPPPVNAAPAAAKAERSADVQQVSFNAPLLAPVALPPNPLARQPDATPPAVSVTRLPAQP
jgi:hypothetical protein